ncbi:hypothetical protein ABTNL_11 [Pseudomonas phage vB_PaeP_PPA-ABTNL]|uniref:Uncharacterized protein n=1 Tax=Pseudomonas phage vB_PaeP_PPA-ABTNL TaxID=1527525 RepID=A0A0B4N5S8_9CAUD|nr:hypothetical protein ACQ50_gp11 [Pseudomonas phage vB_PaeP_PPA-ABTNL]AIK67572.1 hypothetical protein ABTNL_11 [Pseudomonas phage vB_PaeP_PPA-ABTNL]
MIAALFVLGLYCCLGLLAGACYCIAVAPPFENPTEVQFQDACVIGCVWPLVIIAGIFLALCAVYRGLLAGLKRHLDIK